MSTVNQFKLLLKKQITLKKRQPVVFALQILWPLLFLGGIIILRQAIPPIQKNVCYYNARAMPSAGMLPFLQSLVCNIDNECLNETQYEPIPQYKNAQLKQISNELSPLLENKDLNNIIDVLPKTERMIKTLQKTIENPSIKELIDNGIPIKSLFINPDNVQSYLTDDAKLFSKEVADAILNSNINALKLLDVIGKTNFKDIICDSSKLPQYLKIKNESLIPSVSEGLCSINPDLLPSILKKIQKELDVKNLMKKLIRFVEGIGDLTLRNALDDVLSMVDVIVNLESIKNITAFEVPSEFITKLLPPLFDVISSIGNGGIDIEFLKDFFQDIPDLISITSSTKKKLEDIKDIIYLILDIISKDRFVYQDYDLVFGDLFKDKDTLINQLSRSNISKDTLHHGLNAKIINDKVFYIEDQNPVKVFHAVCRFPGVDRIFALDPSQDLLSLKRELCSLHDNDILDLMKQDFSFVKLKKNPNNVNFYDHVIKIIKTNGTQVLKLVEDLIPIPQSWNQLPYVLNIIDKAMGMLTFYYEDLGSDSKYPSIHLASVIMNAGEMILRTLSSPIKVSKLLVADDMKTALCSENYFSDYFVVPKDVDVSKLSAIACRLYEDLLVIGSKPKLIEQKIKFSSLVSKVYDFIHSIWFLNEDIPHLRVKTENFKQALREFHMSPTSSVILNVKFLEFLDARLTSGGYYPWHWFRSKIFSLQDVLHQSNFILDNIIDQKSVTLKAIIVNGSLPLEILELASRLIPDFFNATASILDGNLADFMFKVERIRYLDFPCRIGFHDVLNFTLTDDIVRFHKIICNNATILSHEAVHIPIIKAFYSLMLVKRDDFSIDWQMLISDITDFEVKFNSLSKDIKFFPNFKEFWKNKNSSYYNVMRSWKEDTSKFILTNIVDQVNKWFVHIYFKYNISHPELKFHEIFKNMNSKSFNNHICVIRFFIHNFNAFFDDVNDLLYKYAGKDFTLSDILPDGISKLLNVLVKIPFNVEHASKVIATFSVTNFPKASTFCNSEDEFNSRFLLPNSPFAEDDLYFLACRFPRELTNGKFISKIFNHTYNSVSETLDMACIDPRVSFSSWKVLENIRELSSKQLINNLPKFKDTLFSVKRWKELGMEYFSSSSSIQRFVLKAVLDNPLKLSFQKLKSVDGNITFNAGFKIPVSHGYPYEYLRGFMYSLNFAFYSVEYVLSELSVYLDQLAGTEIDVMDYLPSFGPFSSMEKVILNATNILNTVYDGCNQHVLSVKIRELLMNSSKLCHDKNLISQAFMDTGMEYLVEDIYTIICSDYRALANTSIWLQTDKVNPGLTIYTHLRSVITDEFYPDEKYFDSSKIEASFHKLIKSVKNFTRNPANFTVPSSIKKLMMSDTWKEIYLKSGNSGFQCIFYQFYPVLNLINQQIPESRKYFNMIDGLVKHLRIVLSRHEGKELTFAEVFPNSQEILKLVRLLETNLPEVIGGIINSHNDSIQVKRNYEFLKAPDPLKMLCTRPYDYFILKSPKSTLDLESLQKEFCSLDFKVIMNEFYSLTNITDQSTSEVDIGKMTKLINGFYVEILHSNISIKSPLLNKNRWTAAIDPLISHEFLFRNVSLKIVHLLEPTIRIILERMNETPKLRPIIHTLHFLLLGFRDAFTFENQFFLNLHEKYISFGSRDGIINELLELIFGYDTIFRSTLFTVLHPDKIANIIKDVRLTGDFSKFCSIKIDWKRYLWFKNESTVPHLNEFQRIICRFVNEKFTNGTAIDVNKYFDIISKIKSFNKSDVDVIISEIQFVVEEAFSHLHKTSVFKFSDFLSFHPVLEDFNDEIIKQFDFSQGKIPNILVSYAKPIVLAVPLPYIPLAELKFLTSVLKSASMLMESWQNNSTIFELSPIFKDYPAIEELIEFSENHVMDIVRILVHTVVYDSDKFVSLSSLQDVQSLCTNPEYFFTTPPSSKINLNEIVSKYCSFNFSGILGISSSDLADKNLTFNLRNNFLPNVANFIETVLKFDYDVKLQSPLFNSTKWKKMLENDFISTKSDKFFIEIFRKFIYEFTKDVARFSNADVIFLMMNSTATFTRDIFKNAGVNHFDLQFLQDYFNNKPQMLKIIDLGNEIVNTTHSFLLTETDVNKLLKTINHVKNLSTFCSAKDINTDFASTSYIDWNKYKDLLCNFSSEKLWVELFGVYPFHGSVKNETKSINREEVLKNFDDLFLLLENKYLVNGTYENLRHKVSNFFFEPWHKLFSSIHERYLSNMNINKIIVDAGVSFLDYLPKSKTWFVEPLSITLKSLTNIWAFLKYHDESVFDGYSSFEEFKRMTKENERDFYATMFFIISKFKLQFLPDAHKMFNEACHPEVTDFENLMHFKENFKSYFYINICNRSDEIIKEVDTFTGISKWLHPSREFSDYGQHKANLKNSTMKILTSIEEIIKSKRTRLPIPSNEIMFQVAAPFLNYVVNVTSTTKEAKIAWEVVTSSVHFYTDAVYLVTQFLTRGDRFFTFILPNIISNETDVIPIDLNLHGLLQYTQMIFDVIFNADKMNAIIEDFLLTDRPLHNFCMNGNLSRYFDPKLSGDDPMDTYFCRRMNASSIFHTNLKSWIMDVKNGRLGKVNGFHFLKSIYSISRVDIYSNILSLDELKEQYSMIFEWKRWKDMLKSHLYEPLSRLVSNEELATNYFETVKPTLNRLNLSQQPLHFISRMLDSYNITLSRFSLENKNFSSIFQIAPFLGKFVYVVTDYNLWQNTINLFLHPGKLQTLHNPCKSKFQVLRLANPLNKMLLEVAETICESPTLLKNDILSFIGVSSPRQFFNTANSNTIKLGTLMERIKNFLFETQNRYQQLSIGQYPWTNHMSKLKNLDIHPLQTYFNQLDSFGWFHYVTEYDFILNKYLPARTMFFLYPLVNSYIISYHHFIQALNEYLKSDTYKQHFIYDDEFIKTFFFDMEWSSQMIFENEWIKYKIELLTRNASDVQKKCQIPNFRLKSVSLKEIICSSSPDQWSSSILKNLNDTLKDLDQRFQLMEDVTFLARDFTDQRVNYFIKWNLLWEFFNNVVDTHSAFREDYRKLMNVDFSRFSRLFFKNLPQYIRNMPNCMLKFYEHGYPLRLDLIETGVDIGLEFMKKIPELENYFCELGDKNLTLAYREFMHDLGMKRLFLKITDLVWMQTNTTGQCFSIKSKIADIMEEFISYINNHDARKWTKLNVCFHRLRNSPIISQIDNYLQFLGGFSHINSTRFNLTSSFEILNNDLQPILQEFHKFFAPRVDVFVDFVTIYNKVSSELGYTHYGIYKYPAFFKALSYDTNRLQVNINKIIALNYSAEAVRSVACDSLKIGQLFHFKSNESLESLNVVCDDRELAETLVKMVKHFPMSRDIEFYRLRVIKSFDWLTKLLANMAGILKNFGDLSKLGVNFQKIQDSFADLSISDLISNLVELLNEKKLSNVILHIEQLLNGLRPLIPSSKVVDELEIVLDGVRSLKIVRGTLFSNIFYSFGDLIVDKESMKKFLIDEIKLAPDVVDAIMKSSIHLSKIFSSDVALNKDLICNPFELSKLLNVSHSIKNIGTAEISKSLCSLSISQITAVSDRLIKSVNVSFLVSKFMEVNVKNLLEANNVTEDDVKQMKEVLGTVKKVLPMLASKVEKISKILNSNSLFKKTNVQLQSLADMPVSEALTAAGSVVCGNPLNVLKDKLLIIEDQNNKKSVQVKQSELDSLPTEYCKHLYKEIVGLSGGPIIWGFLKPIMQGRILYSPDTPRTREIILGANETFVIVGEFTELLKRWSKGVKSLEYFQNTNTSQDNFKSILNSTVLKKIIQRFVGSDASSNELDILGLFNSTDYFNSVGNADSMMKLVSLSANISECFNANRFHGYNSEEEVIEATKEFGKKGQFLAGIIFLDDGNGRVKREAVDANKHIRYKIRMDVDSVQSTSYLKDKYWRPKSFSSFKDNLRYQHGFIQLQDIIDRSIIKMLSKRSDSIDIPQVFGQQFPNPCFNKDEFGYYLKGMLPVIMTMAWFFMIAFLIREKVLERELRLEQVMRIMGLKPSMSFLSWFTVNFLIMILMVFAMIIMIKLGQIINFSNWFLLIIFLIDFSFAIIMFCYCISAFFSKATIGALTGLILYLLFYLPFVVTLAVEMQISLLVKLATSLLMSSAFSFGCLYLARFEELGVGIQYSNIWESPLPADDMSFAYALIMLFVDGVVYGLIGWYISNVFPAEKGVLRKSFFFFLLPSYWGCTSSHSFQSSSILLPSDSNQDIQNVRQLEDYGSSVVGLILSNLQVIFNKGKRNQKVAVKNVSLDLYENQITTLLGQNGAGKTTTINVLTGQIVPTEGTAYIGSHCIIKEFKEARKTVGYCPQYNILFDNMTIREHMEFYGSLKGIMPKDKLNADINCMISNMGLERIQDELVKNLSGGMKRRLCVALAFVGGSTTVILDEPTSGVDPLARRSIWDLILKNKQGRTILLTTHYMDEADVMSDRVAILHEGSLLCCGLPSYLKIRYGRGYLLSVEMSEAHMPIDTIPNVSSVNDSCTFGNAATPNIFLFIKNFVANVTLVEEYNHHATFSLPHYDENGCKVHLNHLFEELEKCYEELGIITYNLSCSTLEQAFLNVCSNVDFGSMITPRSESPSSNASSQSECCDVNIMDQTHFINEDPWLTGSTLKVGRSKESGTSCLKVQQFFALIYKRFWHNIRDWKLIFCGIILPCVFIAAAMGFSLIRPRSDENPPSLMLTPSMYGRHINTFFSLEDKASSSKVKKMMRNIYESPGIGTSCLSENYSMNQESCIGTSQNFSLYQPEMQNTEQRTCKCLKNYPIQKCDGDYLGFIPQKYTARTTDNVFNITGHNVNDYLLLSFQDYLENRFGGWSALDDNELKVWYNTYGYHSYPAFLNSISNAMLRFFTTDSNYGITTFNHPIHVTSDLLIQETIAQRVAEIGISLVVVIGYCFIPSCFAVYLVKERMSEEKRLQYISGVGPVLYWITAYFWDTLMIILSVIITTIIFFIFGIPIYTFQYNSSATILLLFLFCWSTTPLMYIMEKFFREGSTAAMILFCFNCFIAINTLVCLLILTLFRSMDSIGSVLNIVEKVFLVFPHFSLGSGLLEISRNQIRAEIYSKFGYEAYNNPFEFLRTNFLIMILQGLIFFIINLIIESQFFCCRIRSKHRDSGMPILDPEDQDVKDERRRVNGSNQDDILKLMSLTKVYKSALGRNIAVDKLCFGVKRGECFGLLGINGAGKTTTFKMLTGDIQPTWGQVLVKDKILSDVIAEGSQMIGYCPQENALDDYLTCQEMLTLFAKLRGIKRQDLDIVLHRIMTKYNLKYFANHLTSKLSGGTKRKLCTAIACLGNPEIILMDEPTSGMDPKTRRLVWNNVQSLIKDQKSVLITSHSMEECDILCTKVAIMVNGKLRCLGSPQYLKNKFNDGHIVTLRLKKKGSDLREVIRYFNQIFPLSSLKSYNYNVVQYSIPSEETPLSTIFNHLESDCEELGFQDFSVSQTSLDQVFVNFSRNQSDGILNEDEIPYDLGEVDDSSLGHMNAAYNKIYGIPDASNVSEKSISEISKSPNMYYDDDEVGIANRVDVTKL